jgi:hypothetical protein
MPIIAYQSFNSNASTTHDLDSLTFQYFTKLANRNAIREDHQALVLPSDPNNLTVPIEGPANLMDIEPLTDDQPVVAFGGQISLICQNLARSLGATPDILVLGEMDSSGPEFVKISKDPSVLYQQSVNEKACQSFTAIIPIQNQTKISRICFGEGYVVYKVFDLNVIFVHVPNAIAKSTTDATNFYRKIIQTAMGKGGVIHLVIGDTNQASIDFTPKCLNAVDSLGKYVNSAGSGKIEVVDSYESSIFGTNSTGTQMYDVAVYRSSVVKLLGGPSYLSQSSTGTTVTDHCGLGVNIDLI